MRLEHVNFTVSDLDRSVAFYRRLFGLDLRWSGHTCGGQPAAHVGTKDWYIALFQGVDANDQNEYERTGYNHFGVQVEDLDAAIAVLEELGASVERPEPYDPGRRIYTYDPDGHEIELVEYATAP